MPTLGPQKIYASEYGMPKPDIFYDRSIRFWTLLWKDEEDNQVGHAEYYDSKMLANYFAKKGFNQ